MATPVLCLCEELGISLTDDSKDESDWFLIHPEADQSAHVQAMAALPELQIAYMHQMSDHQICTAGLFDHALVLILLHRTLAPSAASTRLSILKRVHCCVVIPLTILLAITRVSKPCMFMLDSV